MRYVPLLTIAGLLLMAAPSPAAGPDDDRTNEYRFPRYGGYIPGGAFQPDGGNPWGGYTPFGRDGGWAKLSYGTGYSDFAASYRFGHGEPSDVWRYSVRPPVRGLGRWDRQGRADDE
jgi:hypothetical protein